MLFSARSIMAGLAAALFVTKGAYAVDLCDESLGPFQDTMHFGKQGFSPNTPFCHTKWDEGLVVTGVEVWATRWQISGVRFTYSNNTVGPVQGATNFGENGPGDDQQGGKVRHDFISWDEKDTITSFKVKTNSKGDGLGAVLIEVAGKKLDVYSDNCGAGLDVNYGAGILLGAYGETNSFPTYWTPLFLGHTDATVTMTDMIFDQDLDTVNKQQQGMESLSLSEVWLQNTDEAPSNSSDHSLDQSWSFIGSSTEETSSSISTTTQHQFGLSVGVEVGGGVKIPFLAEASVKVTTTASYSYSSAQDRMSGKSSGQTMTWNLGSTPTTNLVKPGHAKHCTATTTKGHYRGGYTANMHMTVNGKGFDYKKRGTFDSVSYTSVIQKCNDVLIKDIPGGANTTEARSTTKAGKRATVLRA